MGHARVVLRPILMRFIPRFILVSYLDDVDDDDDDDDDDVECSSSSEHMMR